MFTLVILILLTIVFWAICVLLLYLRRQAQRKANLMNQVQTTEASPAYGRSPGELVEVAGTLRCDSPLASEMAGRSCAYYHSEITRVYKVADEDSGPGRPGSAGISPRLGAWLLVLALPGILALSFLGFGNIPSGPALWFCFAWLAPGYSLRPA